LRFAGFWNLVPAFLREKGERFMVHRSLVIVAAFGGCWVRGNFCLRFRGFVVDYGGKEKLYCFVGKGLMYFLVCSKQVFQTDKKLRESFLMRGEL